MIFCLLYSADSFETYKIQDHRSIRMEAIADDFFKKFFRSFIHIYNRYRIEIIFRCILSTCFKFVTTVLVWWSGNWPHTRQVPGSNSPVRAWMYFPSFSLYFLSLLSVNKCSPSPVKRGCASDCVCGAGNSTSPPWLRSTGARWVTQSKY